MAIDQSPEDTFCQENTEFKRPEFDAAALEQAPQNTKALHAGLEAISTRVEQKRKSLNLADFIKYLQEDVITPLKATTAKAGISPANLKMINDYLRVFESYRDSLSVCTAKERQKEKDIRDALDALYFRNIEKLDLAKVDGYFATLKAGVESGELTLAEVTEKVIPINPFSFALSLSSGYVDQTAQKRMQEFKGKTDPYTEATRAIISCGPNAVKRRPKHHIVLKKFAETFGAGVNWDTRAYVAENPTVGTIYDEEALKSNHQGALDVFFEEVDIEFRGEDQIGPAITAFAPGIVIAAGDGWKGGVTEESYVGGGLSPTAGNALIIYNPMSGEYHYYFHFYDLKVKRGDIVSAGDVLGRIGNTGKNTRKKETMSDGTVTDHGRHLHMEIHRYDAKTNQVSTEDCYTIRKKLLATREPNKQS